MNRDEFEKWCVEDCPEDKGCDEPDDISYRFGVPNEKGDCFGCLWSMIQREKEQAGLEERQRLICTITSAALNGSSLSDIISTLNSDEK